MVLKPMRADFEDGWIKAQKFFLVKEVMNEAFFRKYYSQTMVDLIL